MGKPFVGPLPTISASSASGVWQMSDVYEHRSKDTWPKQPIGLGFDNPAPNAVALMDAGLTDSGFYYIQIPGWESPLRIYCDLTRDSGGWMLWANKTTSGSTLDIRNTGYFAGYTSGDGHVTSDWDDLTVDGHVNMWPYFNGSRQIRWYNNITNLTSEDPGSFTTKVLIAQENGTGINSSIDFWNFAGSPCPSSSRRYTYTGIHVDSGWSNSHPSGNYANCSEWKHRGNQAIMNYTASLDNAGNYYPSSRFFGNGGSGYYSYSNRYDYDSLSFNLVSSFADVGIADHLSTSNQLWVK